MAGLIISKLLTDFFNEIGQTRHFASMRSTFGPDSACMASSV